MRYTGGHHTPLGKRECGAYHHSRLLSCLVANVLIVGGCRLCLKRLRNVAQQVDNRRIGGLPKRYPHLGNFPCKFTFKQ